MNVLNIKCDSVAKTVKLGEAIGQNLKGGEVLTFKSDLGGGKTTFISGLARGFGSTDPVSSPSFTISYVYKREDGKALHHYDFYRLNDPGIMASELAEIVGQKDVIVAIEWGKMVANILPENTITISIEAEDETTRNIEFTFDNSQKYLFKELTK